ncbi:HAD family hydrolase [Derxia gummosa]|uniref:HAD family hydrolase n=1 Tax=Derxia gummosa DSM 723 TaxID=1121388 RepID=A0A8B6X7B9_9BURK|nr:HAD family hydrolase [Derxia gummosa]
MNLTLFDLDNTLLPIDSDYEWGQFLVRTGIVDAEEYRVANERFFEQYNDGTLDIFEFLHFVLRPLVKLDRAELDALHARYMTEVIAPNLRPAALDLVRRHRDAGDLCAIVTATNSFITRPIARAFGITELIATEFDEVDGRFTGEISVAPCFKDGKIARTEAWLAARGLDWSSFGNTTFYSDSANDLPLMQRVKQPVAVNPSGRLRDHALAEGWPVIELFR